MIGNSILYKEIFDQPKVLRRFLSQQETAVTHLAHTIKERQINHVVIAARGTSDNAGRYAQYLLGAKNGMVVTLATPSLFTIYQTPPILRNTLVLGISQSGQSPDIVAVLAEGQRQGALTAVLTNSPHSDLAQVGDFVIDLCAGEERAVAATKSYTAELLAIALLSTKLAEDEGMLAEISGVDTAVANTLSMNDAIAKIAPRYRYMRHCAVIGRGFNYATAFETALKMKELTYSIVESYSSADFLHGPMAVVESGFPLLLIAPSGKLSDEMQAFGQKMKERGAELIVVSDEEGLLSLARIPLRLPHSVPEWLSPITAVLPGQLLAMHLAHVRDLDVDSPRGLKKVTETK